jgi:hypothetical protein
MMPSSRTWPRSAHLAAISNFMQTAAWRRSSWSATLVMCRATGMKIPRRTFLSNSLRISEREPDGPR